MGEEHLEVPLQQIPSEVVVVLVGWVKPRSASSTDIQWSSWGKPRSASSADVQSSSCSAGCLSET